VVAEQLQSNAHVSLVGVFVVVLAWEATVHDVVRVVVCVDPLVLVVVRVLLVLRVVLAGVRVLLVLHVALAFVFAIVLAVGLALVLALVHAMARLTFIFSSAELPGTVSASPTERSALTRQ
jgi:hypothetical protein